MKFLGQFNASTFIANNAFSKVPSMSEERTASNGSDFSR
jgi:hypothetical protein